MGPLNFTCDVCRYSFKNIGIKNGTAGQPQPKFECRECEMDLCIECLNDPSLYRSKPETPSLAKEVLTIKVDDNIGPNMVELTRR